MQGSQTCRRHVWCGDGGHVLGVLEGETNASPHEAGLTAVLDDRYEMAMLPRNTTVLPILNLPSAPTCFQMEYIELGV